MKKGILIALAVLAMLLLLIVRPKTEDSGSEQDKFLRDANDPNGVAELSDKFRSLSSSTPVPEININFYLNGD